MSIAIKRNFTIPSTSAIGASELYLTSSVASTTIGTGTLTVAGGAGVSGAISLGGALKLFNGSFYTGFDSAATANTTYIWPATSPSTGTSVLSSDAAGNLSWILMSASGSGLTLNGLTATTQYFSTSISGNGFTIGSIGSTHTYYIGLAGNASTGLISGAAQTIFGLKTFASGVAITSGTASTNTTTGDLVVSGGVGIGDSLYVAGAISVNTGTSGLLLRKLVSGNYGAIYSTGITPSATNYSMITDGASVNFNGTSGVYFNINNTNKIQVTTNNINIVPTAGSSSTSTGALTVAGGVGIGGSIWTSTDYYSSISGVGHSNGVITYGVWSGTAISVVYGGTGLTTYSTGDIVYASSSTTLGKITAGTAGSVLTSAGAGTTPYWALAASTGVTSINGLTTSTQTFSTSISGSGFTIGSTGSTHTYYIGLAGNASTGLISSASQTLFGLKTFASGISVTSGTASTSTTTGDFTVTGGVGIGGSLWTSTTNLSSISGVGISNSVITSGVWSGTAISAIKGGTGLVSYTTGDILYASSSTTLGSIAAGTAGSVLTSAGAGSTPYWAASTGSASGMTLNGLTSTTQYFATSISGSGFTIGSTGSTHNFYVALAGNASTGLISGAAQTIFGLKTFGSGVAITSGTASTNTTTGALTVAGGVGITGQLSVNTIALGTTAVSITPSMIFTGTAGTVITMSVLSDTTLAWEGSSGQLFSIDNNLSSGEIFSVSDISGLPVITASAGQTITLNEFGGFTQVGNGLASTNTTTGALRVIGGVGITGSLYLGSPLLIPSGGTGLTTYTTGDILYASSSTTLARITAGTAGSVLTSAGAGSTPYWAVSTGSGSGITLNGLTATTQTFATSISGSGFTIGSATSTHTFYIGLAGNASTGLISSTGQTIFGLKTFGSGVAITSGTASTSTSTGDLVVSGGVGIGGSLWTSATNFSSISGVGHSNSVITSGVWSGTAISAVNGGTGLVSYTTGDILYASSSTTLARITAGSAGSVLTSAGSGATPYWGLTASTGVTSINGLTASTQTFATSISGSGFTIGSTGSTHTFYIGLAGNASTGLISGAAQTIFGVKTFASGLAITASTGSTSTSTGALIVSGGAGIGGTLTANNIIVSTLTVGLISDVLTASLGTTNTTPDQVVHSISASAYRTLKYVVSIASSTWYQGQEIIVVHNGTNVWMTEYAQVLTGGLGQTLSTFEADINSGNIRLLVTPTHAVTDYKLSCTAIKV
jgi:hypothetical protein